MQIDVPNRMRENLMPISTTQSIWRSGGGDTTRQAYCGSGLMAATFFSSNAAVSSNAVVASSQTAEVILPANAVVTHVMITDALTSGSINVGYQTIDGAVSVPNFFVTAAAANTAKTFNPGATGSGTGIGTVANASVNTVLTIGNGGSAVGNVGGIVLYYVTDYLFGQQNV
jgi:hypothetical protein